VTRTLVVAVFVPFLAPACADTASSSAGDAAAETAKYSECPQPGTTKVPQGSCIVGSSCDVTTEILCSDGSTVRGGEFDCTCRTGSWDCLPIGGLNFTPCPDAGTDADSDAGADAQADAPKDASDG
jgi:hypothetical protein